MIRHCAKSTASFLLPSGRRTGNLPCLVIVAVYLGLLVSNEIPEGLPGVLASVVAGFAGGSLLRHMTHPLLRAIFERTSPQISEEKIGNRIRDGLETCLLRLQDTPLKNRKIEEIHVLITPRKRSLIPRPPRLRILIGVSGRTIPLHPYFMDDPRLSRVTVGDLFTPDGLRRCARNIRHLPSALLKDGRHQRNMRRLFFGTSSMRPVIRVFADLSGPNLPREDLVRSLRLDDISAHRLIGLRQIMRTSGTDPVDRVLLPQ